MDHHQLEPGSERLIKILEEIKEEEPYELGLRSNDDKKDRYMRKLKNYYEQYERHYYSDIAIYTADSTEEDLDYLIQNITFIYDHAKYHDKDDETSISLNVRKILDHIKLERYRLLNLEKKVENQSLKALNTQTKTISNQLETQIETRIKELDNKFNQLNKESVTVISIFSAVIMTFFGGFSFFGEALKNMNDIELRTTLVVITTISFAMFNLFYLLFLLIGKIINKPLVSNNDKIEDDNQWKAFWWTHKINIIVNTVFILIFIYLYYFN